MADIDLNRRSLLAGLGAVGVAATTKSAVAAAPAIIKGLPDVVVVGAGAFGGWSALSLREAGYKVTLVDAYGPGNPHASSGGETRNIRAGYGSQSIYSEWAGRAWKAWHQRQEEFGRQLIFPSGSLRDPGPKEMDAQIAAFDKYKLPYELLTPQDVSRRWPQIQMNEIERIFFEVNSGAVKAREAMIAVSEVFQQKGGTLRIGYATPGQSRNGTLDNVLVDGEPLSAGTYVFGVGPWFPKLFPQFMGRKIRTPRLELFFVAPARGDQRFRWENAPSISDTISYTSPDIGGGYKIAAHPKWAYPIMDPDDGDRMPNPALLPVIQNYIKLRLPSLAGRPILQTYVCQQEKTDTNNYIFDTHPDFRNVWIAGGGSSHSFKMGPIIGPYVTDLVAGKPMSEEDRKLFSLAAHGDAYKATGTSMG